MRQARSGVGFEGATGAGACCTSAGLLSGPRALPTTRPAWGRLALLLPRPPASSSPLLDADVSRSPRSLADGYVLQMQRIPRHGARDVAFFQHGVLDTSLGWVRCFLKSSQLRAKIIWRGSREGWVRPLPCPGAHCGQPGGRTHLGAAAWLVSTPGRPPSPPCAAPTPALQVSNGVVGSAAFAAFDAGFDVWLANSRSNAPRLHIGAWAQGAGAQQAS